MINNPLIIYICNIVLYLFLRLLDTGIYLIILYFLIKIKKKQRKPHDYKYKIHDFEFNVLCIFVYISGYFGFIFWLRDHCINNTTDLKQLYNDFIQKYISENMLDNIVIISNILLLLLIALNLLEIINDFFLIQLKKRWLIINAKLDCLLNFEKIKPFYEFKKVLKDYIQIFIKNDKHRNTIWHIQHRLITFFPTLFLCIFLFTELYFNNGILTPTFYKYLLFYFIYHTLWKIKKFMGDSD